MSSSSLTLAQVIAIITDEVVRATTGTDALCTCHGVPGSVCPHERRETAADARPSGVRPPVGPTGVVASIIDHTLLRPDATAADIERLCAEAAEFGFATVCVNPTWVRLAARCLRGGGVKVCTVVGFPLGATTSAVKQHEARSVILEGAREVDMVINLGALKGGDLQLVERDIEAVTGACRDAGALSKVIIETALLTDQEKITACTLAKAAGADFVKTSTGFAKAGATAADVALMRRVVGQAMGVKAAGGVRDLEGFRAMVAAGATRIGASAGVQIVQESMGKRTAPSDTY